MVRYPLIPTPQPHTIQNNISIRNQYYLPLKRAEFITPPPTARARPNFPIDSNNFAIAAFGGQ